MQLRKALTDRARRPPLAPPLSTPMLASHRPRSEGGRRCLLQRDEPQRRDGVTLMGCEAEKMLLERNGTGREEGRAK